MKAFRKGQKVVADVTGFNEITGIYRDWDGLMHSIVDDAGQTWRVTSDEIIRVKPLRKYKQPPIWARHYKKT
jgi:hypothetical protein